MADMKEIKFKALMDMSDFDVGIQKVQARLKQISATEQRIIGQGTAQGGGGLTPQAQAQRERFQEKVKKYAELESKRLDEDIKKEQERTKELERRLKIAEDAYTKSKKNTDKRERAENVIREILEKQLDIEDKITKKKEQQKDLAEKTGQATGDGSGGDGGGISSQQSKTARFTNMLKGLASSAVVAGALNFAGTIGEDIITRPREMAVSRGGFYRGAARDLREQFGGRASDRAFYAKERAQAASIIRDEYEDKRLVSGLKGGAGGLAGGLVGAGLGAAGGSAIGSFIGGGLGLMAGIGLGLMSGGTGLMTIPAMMSTGAALGGTAGTYIGGAAGAIGGASMGMGKEGRYALFDPERFNAEKMAEAMQQRETLEMSLIMQDPRKYMARESFMANVDKYADVQRRTGLNDEELYGSLGFLQTGIRRGEQFGGIRLQERDILSAQRALQQTSGLTEGSTEMAAFAASLERRGVGGAADIMGKIYGATGAQGTTEEATKKLFAEAVKIGVNLSEMPKELENFTRVAADLATKGGGFSAISAEMLGAGLTGMSQQQIAAAATEVEEFEARAGAAGGYEGQLGLGFFQGDKAKEAFGKEAAEKLKKDPKLMNVLNQLTASDLEKDPALLKAYSQQLGISEEELTEGMRKKDIFKQTRTDEGENLLIKFSEKTKGMGYEELQEFLQTDEGSALYGDIVKTRGASFGSNFIRQGAFKRQAEIGIASGREGKQFKRRRREEETPFMLRPQGEFDLMRSIDEEMFGVQAPMRKSDKGDEVEQFLRGDIKGRAAEQEKGARATGDLARIQAISENASDFAKAAKATTTEMVVLGEQFTALKDKIKETGGDMTEVLEKLEEQMGELSDRMGEAGFTGTK